MSQLNFTRKTFLEREELNRFQEFLIDSTVSNAILDNTTQYGIIQTEFVNADTNFQVTMGTNIGTIQFAKERSQAIDIDGQLIRLMATNNIPIANDGNWYWVRISYQERRHEEGTVSLNANGQLTGVGTSFTEVLRGQATDVPVQVRFIDSDGNDATNNGIYQVVNVIDDTNATLSSTTGFQAESNLSMVVIGATPIGEIVSPSQLTGIYRYDSCLVEVVQETVLDTPPSLPVNGTDRFFYVARVQNSANIITIQDRRDIDETYWKFNVPGISGAVITQQLPPPVNIGDWLLLGSIPDDVTAYVHLLLQGAGQRIGDIIEIRFWAFDSGGGNFITNIESHVVFGGAATGLRPQLHWVLSTAGNSRELWLRAGETDTGLPFIPGAISFVAETVEGGETAWEYANNFTWTSTAPTNPTAGSHLFGVYGTTQIISNLDTRLSTIDADITANSTSIDALENDTGYIAASVHSSLDTPTSKAEYRQVGNVVTVNVRVLLDGTPTGTNITLFTKPNAVEGPGISSVGSQILFPVVTFASGSTNQNVVNLQIDANGNIMVNNLENFTVAVHAGTVTYVV